MPLDTLLRRSRPAEVLYCSIIRFIDTFGCGLEFGTKCDEPLLTKNELIISNEISSHNMDADLFIKRD